MLPNFMEDDDATDTVPVIDGEQVDAPKLILTLNGKTLRELDMDRPRLLVGRSEHNDLVIDSTVNSRHVSNLVMVHDDIVSLGHHRIKFVDPNAKERAPLDGDSFADTAIMKDLSDLRARIARETTVSLPSRTNLSGGDHKA
jgi:hypothetical protein